MIPALLRRIGTFLSGERRDAPFAAQIISATDPWILCNAVGSLTGSNGYRYGFGSWFDLAFQNFGTDLMQKSNATRSEIKAALLCYAQLNAHKDYKTVFDEEQSLRGQQRARVLAPGESVTVSMPLKIGLDNR